MPDIADKAEDLIELTNEVAVNEIRNKSHRVEVQAIGECLYCGEPLTDGKRWCSAEHRDDWSYRRKHGK